MTTYGTFNGKPIINPAPRNKAGKAIEVIGHDADGNGWGYEILDADMTVVGSYDNPGTLPQKLSYTRETGSNIGFTQKVGLSITVNGGIDLGVVNFGANVTATGELGFSQAFSSVTRITAEATAAPGKAIAIYEGALYVRYWKLAGAKFLVPGTTSPVQLETRCYYWVKGAHDTIESGVYRVAETDSGSLPGLLTGAVVTQMSVLPLPHEARGAMAQPA
ncbi:MAG: hypothetical protein V2I65_09670 [Paracoccaceae bacterium]|jgi:hypothetical protein|nr:hypothetical protein [Paracoccaceae bacterium]